MNLFEQNSDSPNPPQHASNGLQSAAPLAERMRPRTLDEMVGQRRLLAPGSALRRAVTNSAWLCPPLSSTGRASPT